MKEFSTQLDLILYIINELEKVTNNLKDFTDEDLTREEKRIINEIADKLENFEFKPRPHILKQIFDYSKSSQIYNSKYCGEIEVVLN